MHNVYTCIPMILIRAIIINSMAEEGYLARGDFSFSNWLHYMFHPSSLDTTRVVLNFCNSVIHIFFFIMVYYRVFNTVPCAKE